MGAPTLPEGKDIRTQKQDNDNKDTEQKVNLAPLFGAATALMVESPFHRHMFLGPF